MRLLQFPLSQDTLSSSDDLASLFEDSGLAGRKLVLHDLRDIDQLLLKELPLYFNLLDPRPVFGKVKLLPLEKPLTGLKVLELRLPFILCAVQFLDFGNIDCDAASKLKREAIKIRIGCK